MLVIQSLLHIICYLYINLFLMDLLLKMEALIKRRGEFLWWWLNQRSKKTEDFKEKTRSLFSQTSKRTTKKSMFYFLLIMPMRSEISHCAAMKAEYRKKHENAPDIRIQFNEVICQFIKGCDWMPIISCRDSSISWFILCCLCTILFFLHLLWWNSVESADYSVVRRAVVGPWRWAREGNEKDMLGLGEAKQGSENWGRSVGAIINLRASLMVQMVKNMPAMQEWKWKCWSLSRVWLFASPWICTHRIIEVSCHFLLQGIFPTQGLNLSLLHWRMILSHLSHQAVQQCKVVGFDPWVGKISLSRTWQPTLIFLSREFHGQRSLVGHKQLDTTKSLTLSQSI